MLTDMSSRRVATLAVAIALGYTLGEILWTTVQQLVVLEFRAIDRQLPYVVAGDQYLSTLFNVVLFVVLSLATVAALVVVLVRVSRELLRRVEGAEPSVQP